MRRTFLIAGLLIAGTVGTERCQAQMFGARTFGQSLQPQSNPGGGSFGGPTPAPGITPGGAAQSSISSSARFLRQNRTSNDFVGKDTSGTTRPVGVAQPLDTFGSQPAALELIERRIPETVLNPPRTAGTRSRMYEPKLVIGFRPVARSSESINASLSGQMTRLSELDPNLELKMTVVGSTVRLEGQVSSEEAKALIEQVMLFEPGISAVQNDLQVLSVVP